MIKYLSVFLISVFYLIVFSNNHCSAQIPDTGFGENGSAFTGFGNYNSYCMASALHADGKIVAAGYNGNSTNAVLVAQYNSDGSPDVGFNGTGMLQFSFGSTYEEGLAIATTPEGRTVVGGLSFGNAALAMLNPDGSFVESFNAGGKLRISFGTGNGSRIEKIEALPDGMILAAGWAYNGTDFDFMALKVDQNGMFDPDFGTDGKVVADIGGYADYGYDFDIQSDGSIVIGGYSMDAQSVSSFAAIRLNSDGTKDNLFGQNGRFLLSLGTLHNEIDAVEIQSDDKIVLAGRTDFNSIVIRLTSDGMPDNTFGSSGYTITDISGSDDRYFDVALQPDGRILAAGWVFTEFGLTEHVVVRYTETGNVDNSFNGNGKYVVSLGAGGSWANQLMVQPDGMLLIGGQASLVLQGYAHFAFHRLAGVTTGTETRLMPEIAAFPNPATDLIFVDLPDYRGQALARIFDQSGRLCSVLAVDQMTGSIDVKALRSGLYFMRITSGNHSGIVKLIRL